MCVLVFCCQGEWGRGEGHWCWESCLWRFRSGPDLAPPPSLTPDGGPVKPPSLLPPECMLVLASTSPCRSPAMSAIASTARTIASTARSKATCASPMSPATGRRAATASGLSTSATCCGGASPASTRRSEEHTSELQSLMRISYAVFCLKKKKKQSKTKIYSDIYV